MISSYGRFMLIFMVKKMFYSSGRGVISVIDMVVLRNGVV